MEKVGTKKSPPKRAIKNYRLVNVSGYNQFSRHCHVRICKAHTLQNIVPLFLGFAEVFFMDCNPFCFCIWQCNISVDCQNANKICVFKFVHVIPLESKKPMTRKLKVSRPKITLSIDYQKPTRWRQNPQSKLGLWIYRSYKISCYPFSLEH